MGVPAPTGFSVLERSRSIEGLLGPGRLGVHESLLLGSEIGSLGLAGDPLFFGFLLTFLFFLAFEE